MARISTYANDVTLSKTDKVIGTDSSGNTTRNFTLNSIAEIFSQLGLVAIAGQSSFKFQSNINDGRLAGTISLDAGGGNNTALSGISSFKISKYNASSNIIINYLETLVGQFVFVGQVDDINNFGIYKLSALTQDDTETDFYNATLSHIESNGNILEDEFYAFAVYPGFVNREIETDLTDNHYVHNQNNAATTWTVNHNLGKYPSVSITLSTGAQGIGAVQYNNINSLTITLAAAESGYAYLN
jgi:hypothetical protein